ncbi:hypothetical protein AB2B38_010385 [Balneola sp. MJW-20]|uniref:hypothetical protein n=1 Tax=Gracilimonas aurantiaca TaxID=3234185 RepID=UPI003467BC48
MTEEERKKLVTKRKKELREKEMLKSLHTDLDLEERKLAVKEAREKNENKYARKAVIFFGNLFILYFSYFIIRSAVRFFIGPFMGFLGIDPASFSIVFHASIWGISIYSTYTEDRLLDRIIDRFS